MQGRQCYKPGTLQRDASVRHPHPLDSEALVRVATERLYASSTMDRTDSGDLAVSSAVLMLLCDQSRAPGERPQPCLVLNKRSPDVRQPGDLCFPGGGVSLALDSLLSRLLRVPGSPLRKWRHYERWYDASPDPVLPLVVASALREAFEEMRLSPWRTTFVGLLPPQGLRVMRRAIHPVVAWLERPQPFRVNWEVDRVVILPIAQLLDGSRHGRLRVRYEAGEPPIRDGLREEFGCLELDGELLWGLTYRMVEQFLELVLDFSLPSLASRKAYELVLPADYFTRKRKARRLCAKNRGDSVRR